MGEEVTTGVFQTAPIGRRLRRKRPDSSRKAWRDHAVAGGVGEDESDIVRSGQEEDRKYGQGFWFNDCGQLWPDLPRDGFTASAAGGHYASVFPALRLVVVQNPGPYVSDNWGSAAQDEPGVAGDAARGDGLTERGGEREG